METEDQTLCAQLMEVSWSGRPKMKTMQISITQTANGLMTISASVLMIMKK